MRAADTIGGTAAGAGNVIGGLSGFGIEMDDSAAPDGTNNNVIEGNFLGTDPTGALNFGNAIGILLAGEAVTQGVANITVSGNVIANESLVGVEIFGVGAKDNLVEGNFIGTDPTGTASLGNGVGIEIAGGALQQRHRHRRYGRQRCGQRHCPQYGHWRRHRQFHHGLSDRRQLDPRQLDS